MSKIKVSLPTAVNCKLAAIFNIAHTTPSDNQIPMRGGSKSILRVTVGSHDRFFFYNRIQKKLESFKLV